MAIIKKDPFDELSTMRREMDRLFGDIAPWRQYRQSDEGISGQWAPKVDIFEDGAQIVISAALPGMKQEDIKVNIENNILTLSGERRLENEEKRDNYTRIEQYYGTFHRTFALTNQIDQTKIGAHFENGILSISLPKREEAKPKAIEIKVH
ncbi:MAG TPA: Hsp20/alpha crystallin family protein [bacterium]|nr:Hsp20/alpha crystallin family protein [bacterium]